MPSNGGRQVNASPALPTQYVQNTGADVRRLANDRDGRGATAAYGAATKPAADPNGTLAGYATSFNDSCRILMGTIVDGTALANCYRVLPDHGTCGLIAAASSHTSSACFGATAINTYAPGSRVILSVHDKDRKAVILGAVANYLDIGKRAVHDYISPASRKRVDDCHKKYIKQPNGGQIVDYSSGRPIDATLASEWGAITTTGAAITLDDFMFRASINEFCGMYGFYHDSLLRVAGYNLQLWTAGHERDAVMDQAEYNDIQGYTPYPWENVGILQTGIENIQQYESENYMCSRAQPFYARWENKHEFAQPYHRTIDFYGYLGQGHRRVVQAPPPGVQRWTYDGETNGKGDTPYDSDLQVTVDAACSSGPDKLTNHEADKPVIGLTEQNTALDGRIFFASAKGITLLKRILLPIPHRIRRPENVKNGDDAKTNYKAAGKIGEGPDHAITGDIETTDEEYPNLQRASGVLDLHGYLFNYVGLHPFYWHAKDYKTWEQQDIKHASANQRIPQFNRLMGSMYLKEETPRKLDIDHRYKDQKFYETECYVSLLEDGGVVIGDGYGAEIRMSAGCVTISAPGDVWLKGGRDVQTWAGNDAIIKANQSIDISSTQKHIRVKAERNLLLFGGNEDATSDIGGGGRGGVLIESRSENTTYDFEKCGDQVEFGGIVLRAPNSNVIGMGKNIYLRTGGGSVQSGGNITLDSGKGDGDIITKSKGLYQFVVKDGKIIQFFGNEDDYKKSNLFSQNFTLLCGPIGTTGHFIAGGGILCKKSILVTDGHILTEKAGRGAIFVGPCIDECKTKVDEGIDQIEKIISETLPDAGEEMDKGYLEQTWYGEKRAGNDRVMEIMGFSFRTDDDYKIQDFLLYEDRWQQLARLSGQEPQMWTETAVKSKVCEKTYPFPGKKWLIDEKVYKGQDFQIATYENGGIIDKKRGEAPDLVDAYKKPKFKQPEEPKAIDGNYPIIPRS
jgi:hypothetical protein